MAVSDSDVRRRPRYQPDFVAGGVLGVDDIRRELQRIAEYLTEPMFDAVYFTIQTELAARPREGMVAYYAAGVAGAAGLYQYKGGAWTAM